MKTALNSGPPKVNFQNIGHKGRTRSSSRKLRSLCGIQGSKPLTANRAIAIPAFIKTSLGAAGDPLRPDGVYKIRNELFPKVEWVGSTRNSGV